MKRKKKAYSDFIELLLEVLSEEGEDKEIPPESLDEEDDDLG